MIPTREQIEADWANPRFTPETTALIWLRAMRDEIDRLTDANTDLRDKVDDTDGRIAAMEIHGNSADHWYRKATAYKNAFSERDAALAEVTKLRADLDRANTEAALARDAMAKATTDTCAKVQNELRSVERALCSADVLIKYAEWPRGTYECHVKNTIETAIDALRDDSATPPYSPPFEGDPKDCAFKASDPVREAAIRAWEEEALTVESGEEPFGQGYFLLRRSEITAAVALMRSADGKALLRELRAWICGEWSSALAFGSIRRILDGIDEMLAQPAPSHIYSRGRTIAESAEPPTAYYPPAPVEQPAAAVPDDTRELVAQLADVAAAFFVSPWGDRAAEIAAKLRGGA